MGDTWIIDITHYLLPGDVLVDGPAAFGGETTACNGFSQRSYLWLASQRASNSS